MEELASHRLSRVIVDSPAEDSTEESSKLVRLSSHPIPSHLMFQSRQLFSEFFSGYMWKADALSQRRLRVDRKQKWQQQQKAKRKQEAEQFIQTVLTKTSEDFTAQLKQPSPEEILVFHFATSITTFRVYIYSPTAFCLWSSLQEIEQRKQKRAAEQQLKESPQRSTRVLISIQCCFLFVQPA